MKRSKRPWEVFRKKIASSVDEISNVGVATTSVDDIVSADAGIVTVIVSVSVIT